MLTDDDPFAVVEFKENSLNLLEDSHVGLLSEVVKAFELEVGVKCKLIVIDTLARATPGGDENSTKDMGQAIVNSQAIIDRTGCCVMLVHHSGKASDKGMRGSSALLGGLDSNFEVFKHEDEHSVRVFRVKKQRDEAEARDYYYKLELVTLGVDLDLEDVTTCLVRFIDQSEVPVKKDKGQVDIDNLLHMIPVEGVQFNALMASTGISRTTLKKRLAALVGDGTLTVDKAGAYCQGTPLDDPDDEDSPNYDPTRNL